MFILRTTTDIIASSYYWWSGSFLDDADPGMMLTCMLLIYKQMHISYFSSARGRVSITLRNPRGASWAPSRLTVGQG